MTYPTLRDLRALMRDCQGSASLEVALGAAALIAVSGLAFDLYSRLNAEITGFRIAVTMADYLSQETAPDGDEVVALGRFLHERELGVPAHLAFVISAVHRPPGDRLAEVLWSDDMVRFGDAAEAQDLVDACVLQGDAGWKTTLLGEPSRTGMTAGETVVVVEVCARLIRQGLLSSRLFAGDIYRFHALPLRNAEQTPSRPVHSPPPADATAALREAPRFDQRWVEQRSASTRNAHFVPHRYRVAAAGAPGLRSPGANPPNTTGAGPVSQHVVHDPRQGEQP